jgi:hypothetical protein
MTTPDFLFLAATVAFFALCAAYASVCEKFR